MASGGSAGCVAAVVLVLGAGCGQWRGPGPVSPPPTPNLGTSVAAVRVALVWAEPVDLDLYVTDPAQETVYFANNPSSSGGRLENDRTCRDQRARPPGGGVSMEVVDWVRAAPGRYRVGVDFSNRCDGNAETVAFRVVAEYDGKHEERVAELGAERFEPVVLEFESRGRDH